MTEHFESLNIQLNAAETETQYSINKLFEYLSFPTISKDPSTSQAFDGAIQWLSERCTSAGFEVVIDTNYGRPILFAQQLVDSNLPTVLFYGHYDVQPPGDLNLWTSDPFKAEIRNNRIYARGVGDNKGQNFCHIEACRIIKEHQEKLPCNVKLLFEGEEETGSTKLQSYLLDNAKILECDLVIISDGPFHESGKPSVVFGCRGVQTINITIDGPSRDLHSGNFGGAAINPAIILSQLICEFIDENGRIKPKQFWEDVNTPSNEELVIVSNLEMPSKFQADSLKLRTQTSSKEYYSRLYFEPAFGVAGIESGGVGTKGKNIIPSKATARIEFRLVADQIPEKIQRLTKELVEKFITKMQSQLGISNINFSVQCASGMFPARTPMTNKYTNRILKAVGLGQKENPLIIPCLGGSLPDYNFHKSLGKPVITIPYANFDEANHSPDENLEVIRFISGIRTSIALIHGLAE